MHQEHQSFDPDSLNELEQLQAFQELNPLDSLPEPFTHADPDPLMDLQLLSDPFARTHELQDDLTFPEDPLTDYSEQPEDEQPLIRGGYAASILRFLKGS